MNKWQDLIDKHLFCKDEIVSLYQSWWFDNVTKLSKNEIDIVGSFIEFATKEIDQALIEPRGRDGKSYLERAKSETLTS